MASALALLAVVGVGCGGGGAEGAAEGHEPSTSVAPSTAPTTAPTSTAPEPPTCPASGAAVSIRVTDAAMGLRYMVLALTNCGAETYTVAGYPEITLLDEEGQPYDAVQVLHGAGSVTGEEGYCTPSGRFDDGPQSIQLAPGEAAQAGVAWRNTTTGEFDLLVNAPVMAIVPGPGEQPQPLTPDAPVDLGTTGRLAVSAWRPDGSSC
jgi:Protein of unknown function (DUF4232)